MSEKSPYREVGIRNETSRKDKRSRAKLFKGPGRGVVLGHVFDRDYFKNMMHDLCLRCGHARFTVEADKCRGRKAAGRRS